MDGVACFVMCVKYDKNKIKKELAPKNTNNKNNTIEESYIKAM